MKICILDSGVLGSSIGGVMTESGSEVYQVHGKGTSMPWNRKEAADGEVGSG